MVSTPGPAHGYRATQAGYGVMALVLAWATPAEARAQQLAAAPTPLVFEGVTVVDVEQGKLLPDRRVVIASGRIAAVENTKGGAMPGAAQVVEARGKYLIPGLWDMHTHVDRKAQVYQQLLLANGVTGVRDAGSPVPLDTLLRWRRDIVAGRRVGPPRQILSGQSIGDSAVQARVMALESPIWQMIADQVTAEWKCRRSEMLNSFQNCVVDIADARRVVDSLKAAGADMIKPRAVPREIYFAIAAEARRLHIPFGGHVWDVEESDAYVTAVEASDSGASIVDHADYLTGCWRPPVSAELCRSLADRFRRNGTWWVPTLTFGGIQGAKANAVRERFAACAKEFWEGSFLSGNWLGDSGMPATLQAPSADSGGALRLAQRSGLPILAGTDNMRGFASGVIFAPGFALHAELATYVAEGLTPLAALQAATINPAKFLNATDSLGTVAPGKLADLVLLDADPLANITNTTTIRAVVANGRYFDRVALDNLLAEARANGQ